MPSIPNPWILLSAAGLWLASCVGVFFWAQGIRDDHWKAQIAVQEQAASALYIDALNRNAALESSNAEFARNLDETHAKAIANLDSTRDDFTRRLRASAARACGGKPAGTEAVNSGSGQIPAGGSDLGLSGIDVAGLERIVNGASKLALYARECHSFAERVGR